MQALVVRTSGFLLDLSSVSVVDVDAQANAVPWRASKETCAIFGFSDGAAVMPHVRLANETFLNATEYIVAPEAMAEMGFPRQHLRVMGAQFGAKELVDCRFEEEIKSGFGRCEMRAEFSVGVDTLVVLQAVVHKSRNESSSIGFISDLKLKC